MPLSQSALTQLEKYGPNQIRTLMASGNLPGGWNVGEVTQWLAVKEQDERDLSAASQAEQIAIARTASDAATRAAVAAERASVAAERQAVAAERANRRATIALVIAIVSIIATVIGMVIVHFDTVRQAVH